MKNSKGTMIVRNDFVKGYRRIIVHDSSKGEHGDDTVISWDEEKKFEVGLGDHLLITVAPGPGYLKRESNIDLHLNPGDGFNFTLYSSGTEGITISPFEEDTIRIPKGPPTWQLLFKRSSESCKKGKAESVSRGTSNVTVGDNGPGGN